MTRLCGISAECGYAGSIQLLKYGSHVSATYTAYHFINTKNDCSSAECGYRQHSVVLVVVVVIVVVIISVI